MDKTTETRLNRCRSILGGDWLNAETHEIAEAELNQLVVELYADADSNDVNAWLDALGPCYQQSVIADRLQMTEAAEHLDFYESDGIEISQDEIDSSIESGQAVEVSPSYVIRIMGRLH